LMMFSGLFEADMEQRAEILWSIGSVLQEEGGVGAGFGRQGVLVLQGWECPLGLVQSKIGPCCNNFKNVM
jgi:hypothetical protein